jgi:hypothetical protein
LYEKIRMPLSSISRVRQQHCTRSPCSMPDEGSRRYPRDE